MELHEEMPINMVARCERVRRRTRQLRLRAQIEIRTRRRRLRETSWYDSIAGAETTQGLWIFRLHEETEETGKVPRGPLEIE